MALTASQIEAIERLAPIKFHQIFKIPATETHSELKVSYAIAGPSDENVPTILFVAGMLGIRWLAFLFDHVATVEGVRVILIDRWVVLSLIQLGVWASSCAGCTLYFIVPS